MYSNHIDLSSTATVRVTVTDVNDNNPQFGSSHYKFEVEVGQRIAGEVFANDSDTGNNAIITFSISTSTDLLSIEKTGDNTANIVVMEDEVAEIEFGIVAIDGGGRTGSSRVTVNIVPAQTRSSSINTPVVVVAVIICVAFLAITVTLLVVISYYCTGRCKKQHFRLV